jgi:Domain of unknown function (DUF5666)
MRRALIGIGAGVFAVVTAAPAFAQEKWVRGTVTAVTGNSITVKAKGKDYTIGIDKATDVTAPGAGTATRAAQKAGETGIHVPEVIKVGSGAEVRYRESGGTMTATSIRGGLPASGEGSTSEDSAAAAASSKTLNASGTVTEVTGNSLTVKTASGSQTFAIDKDTVIVGEGVGTLSRKMKEAGKGMTITDAVAVGDTVSVRYHDMGATKHAAEVSITRKAKM